MLKNFSKNDLRHRSLRLKMYGNSVVPQIIVEIFKAIAYADQLETSKIQGNADEARQ
jgi:isocitrate lyase